jgi:hypothetical protein
MAWHTPSLEIQFNKEVSVHDRGTAPGDTIMDILLGRRVLKLMHELPS